MLTSPVFIAISGAILPVLMLASVSPIMSKIIKLREKYDVHMVVEKYKLINDLKDEKYIRK